jgi:membrane fusion protein (multidrug efflux system)
VATDLDAAQSAERVADARFNSSLNSVREKIALVGVQEAELALAKQQLEDTVVVAPFDGMIQSRMVAVGTYLQVGQPIVELARTSILRYRASVPERFAQELKIGQPVRILLDQHEREARVARISPTLDPLSRSLTFEATVPNSDNSLRSGLFASAEVIIDESASALAIPASALSRFAGVEKVWRVADGEVAEAVVQIGREVDGMLEIKTGLSEGDQVLLLGETGRVGKYVSEDAGDAAAGSADSLGQLPSVTEEDSLQSVSKATP